MLKRIKTITSDAGLARWYAEVPEGILGYIPRQADIPQPYAYGPSHAVSCWRDRPVIVVETRHKRYEVFAVPAEMIQPTEERACARLY